MREQITILVDADLAESYRSASESERRKLDLLINIRLRSIGIKIEETASGNNGRHQPQGSETWPDPGDFAIYIG